MVCQANMSQDDSMGARLMQALPMVVKTQVSKMTGAPAGRAAATGEQIVPPEMTQPGTQPEAGTSPG